MRLRQCGRKLGRAAAGRCNPATSPARRDWLGTSLHLGLPRGRLNAERGLRGLSWWNRFASAPIDGPGARAGHSHRAVAQDPEEGGADQGRRLRRLRHRPAHPEGPLAETAAVAVHARPRDRRRAGRGRLGIHRGFHEQAARGGVEGDDPAADAVRPLLLLHPLPAERQQVPDAGLLRPLSRLRQGAASVGRLGRICLCRSRHAAGHQDLQASGRHVAAARRAVGAADLLHPRLQPRHPGRRVRLGRHRRDPGLGPDRHSGGRGRAGDGRRPGDLRRRAGDAAAAARAQIRRRGHRRYRAGHARRRRGSAGCATSSAASAPIW